MCPNKNRRCALSQQHVLGGCTCSIGSTSVRRCMGCDSVVCRRSLLFAGEVLQGYSIKAAAAGTAPHATA
jgi:hypothetical protein